MTKILTSNGVADNNIFTYTSQQWLDDAVIYQVFPTSFKDGNGDGYGDLPGVISKLPYIASLGVDALWLSPFYTSPQLDTGYDVKDFRNVDERYGTLQDFDTLLKKAHAMGLKVIIDIVPNHTSDQHPWFQEALASAPGSKARDRYIFRDGLGENGELPPNNWDSVFNGGAWKRVEDGQWYMHLFSEHQPDLNWENTEVLDEFCSILRFWLDRKVDGIRIDAAYCLFKQDGYPDVDYTRASEPGYDPRWDRDEVLSIYQQWRKVIDEYDGRVMIGEIWGLGVDRIKRYLGSDRMQAAFTFDFMRIDWAAQNYVKVITESIAGYNEKGANPLWVMNNHDQSRAASRLGLTHPRLVTGIGPHNEQPNSQLGLRRARATAGMMLGLPGGACLFQGEELGLPDHSLLEDNYRVDPRWSVSPDRLHDVGRDGTRVPLPWKSNAPAYGFSATGHTWLPQPDVFRKYAVNRQERDHNSTLSFYRKLLALRAHYSLGSGALEWETTDREDIVQFSNGNVRVIINFGAVETKMPEGDLLICSDNKVKDGDAMLPGNSMAWLLVY